MADLSCGNCGLRFATKGEKKRHKLTCQGAAEQSGAGEQPDNSPRFSLHRHITPAIKARADAEWAAMDWRGRLPKGWTYEGTNP